MHTVYETCSGLMFNEKSGESKKSELILIQAADLLALKSEFLTFDTLYCQTQILDYIVKDGGDCILPVKGNQPKLYEAVQAQFTDYIENKPDAEYFILDDR